MTETRNKRLDGWKVIAAYLGRDVTTVYRWTKEKGMPVHRVPGGSRRAVFAYAQEIDQWLSGTRSDPEERQPAPLPGPDAGQPHARRSSIALFALGIGLSLLAVAFLVAAASRVWKAQRSSIVAKVTLLENKFEARDKTGRVLWTYPLPEGVGEIPGNRASGITYIGDLDGDGKREVLVSVPLADIPYGPVDERELYCFSDTGKLLWRFDFRDTLTFGSGDYGPPWHIRGWLLHRAAGQARIALALHHHTWWPSILVLLDGRGQEVGRFVNSGIITSLSSMKTSTGWFLLTGGVSNANDVAGMLAVLDGNRLSGSSPEQAGSGFECKSCPPGQPLRYFVFPRSELNVVAFSHHNRVDDIRPFEDHIWVHTLETADGIVRGIFEFSRDFELKRASYSDGYRDWHERLEREGKMTHPWRQCPDRNGPRLVRSWDPEHGWTDIRPPSSEK